MKQRERGTHTKPGGLVLGHDEPGVIIRVHVVGKGDSTVGDCCSSREPGKQHQHGWEKLNQTDEQAFLYLDAKRIKLKLVRFCKAVSEEVHRRVEINDDPWPKA